MTSNTRFVTSRRQPTNEVTCIEGEAGFSFILWKDWQLLMVSVIPCAGTYAHQAITALDDVHELQIIQTMLTELNFDGVKRVYLVGQSDGSYRCVYKPLALFGPPLNSSILAPLVDEKDIEVISWNKWNRWAGRWNGRDVDVLLTSGDESSREYEQETEGHKLMEQAGLMDLKFEFVGHVVRDGAIVGIMTEAAIGEVAQESDRALVFEAISRLQSKRLLHRTIRWASIAITKGRVRFTHLQNLELFHDEDELSKEAEHWHWEKAKILFQELEELDLPREYPVTPWGSYTFAQDIPSIPSVARPSFSYIPFQAGNFQLSGMVWIPKEFNVTGSSCGRGRSSAYKNLETRARRLILAPECSANEDDHSSEEHSQSPSATHRIRIRTHPTQHPYRRVTSSSRLILAPDIVKD